MTQFVIVGNKLEEDEFMSKHKDQHGIYTVTHVGALKGKTIGDKDTIMFYGTALKRKDIGAIMKMIERCRRR